MPLDFWYPSPHQFDDQTWEGIPAAVNAWDTCYLGGNQLPGLCMVKVGKGRKLDIKQPPGSHGATITDQGYKPAPVTITQTIWTPTHWTQQQTIQPQLEPAPSKSYTAPSFDIRHPATALRGVKAVIIEEIEGPELSPTVRGAMVITYKCVQFFPPPKNTSATNTPKNSIQGFSNALTGSPGPTDPSTVPVTPT